MIASTDRSVICVFLTSFGAEEVVVSIITGGDFGDGTTFVTVITAYLHIGVVIGLLPTTGLTLPFVSYGRSNIVLTMFLTGILVNIGSTRERVVGSGATVPTGP